MTKSARLLLAVIGTFLATASLAEDSDDAGPEPVEDTAVLEGLLAESGYGPRWRLQNIEAAEPATAKREEPIAAVEFVDADSLARIMKLRTLSFLTLSNSGRTRLFFGVNEKGLVGFHYRAISDKSKSGKREAALGPYISRFDMYRDAAGVRHVPEELQ